MYSEPFIIYLVNSVHNEWHQTNLSVFSAAIKKMLFILDKELRVVKIYPHPREILPIHFQDLQLRKEIPHVRY